jgi:hypothetical protein
MRLRDSRTAASVIAVSVRITKRFVMIEHLLTSKKEIGGRIGSQCCGKVGTGAHHAKIQARGGAQSGPNMLTPSNVWWGYTYLGENATRNDLVNGCGGVAESCLEGKMPHPLTGYHEPGEIF